jgi:hypothetical protein
VDGVEKIGLTNHDFMKFLIHFTIKKGDGKRSIKIGASTSTRIDLKDDIRVKDLKNGFMGIAYTLAGYIIFRLLEKVSLKTGTLDNL